MGTGNQVLIGHTRHLPLAWTALHLNFLPLLGNSLPSESWWVADLTSGYIQGTCLLFPSLPCSKGVVHDPVFIHQIDAPCQSASGGRGAGSTDRCLLVEQRAVEGQVLSAKHHLVAPASVSLANRSMEDLEASTGAWLRSPKAWALPDFLLRNPCSGSVSQSHCGLQLRSLMTLNVGTASTNTLLCHWPAEMAEPRAVRTRYSRLGRGGPCILLQDTGFTPTFGKLLCEGPDSPCIRLSV